jgi:hypothetical protein
MSTEKMLFALWLESQVQLSAAERLVVEAAVPPAAVDLDQISALRAHARQRLQVYLLALAAAAASAS